MTTTEPTANDAEALSLANTRAAKKEHDSYVAWAKEQFQSIKNARVATERQWYLNLAFYHGKQNVQLIKSGATLNGGVSTRLWVPPAPYYRARPVINRIRPTIRTELAQLTNNKPNASVIPASAEDRDMYAAMAGEQIWEYLYSEHKLKAVIRRAMWWTLVCGTGYIKSYYDFTKGDPVPSMDPETGQLIMKPQGDMCYHHETPFHVFVPDFREEEIENQPFLIHAQLRSPEYVQMNFPTALDRTRVDTTTIEASELLEESFLNMIGTQSLSKKRNCLVLEVWVKPGQFPQFKEGAFFTIVGDKIVQGYRQWPYRHKKYPFAKFDHIPSGRYYGVSVIEDLIPLQKEFNRTRGQIIEAKNRMAKPQLSAARGSVDASKITSEPGQIIFYTPGMDPPQPIPLQGLPNYVVQELERIIIDWDDISGQHEVTKGSVPPGVTAATAISYLQERDESKLSPTYDSLEEGIEKIAHLSLTYVRDYWDTERLIKISGPDGSFDTLAFKGSDLRDNTDIKIEGGSSLPNSKAAKQAFVMDLMKMGFIDPKEGLDVMEMGGINKIYEKIRVDQQQARRENLRMSKVTEQMLMEYQQQNDMLLQQNPEHFGSSVDPMTGEQMLQAPPILIPVNTWDNHQVHIEVHNNFRKGQAFESLPGPVKALFEAHVNEHVMAMGLESETMNPRKSVGLPPEPGEEEGVDSGEGESPTGPEPMPENQLGME